MKLGKRIRELREQMGLSQDQLAGDAKMSQSYLCHLEHEEVKNPGVAILAKLATALDVDPVDLFDAAGYPTDQHPDGDKGYKTEVYPDLPRKVASMSPERQRALLIFLEGAERENQGW